MPILTNVISVVIKDTVKKTVKGAVKQATNNVLKKVGGMIDKQNLLLKYDIDRMEQYSRRETIRVAGMEEQGDETDDMLRAKLVKIGDDCEVKFQSEAISVCHRVGRKKEGAGAKPRDVLCRFVSRATKIAMMSNKKNLKGKRDVRAYTSMRTLHQ